MALNIKIDLGDRYHINKIHSGQGYSEFNTLLKGGKKVRIGIRISPTVHPLMPEVHNLAFGPLDKSNEIDDHIKLTHIDHNKVFSTIIFEALSFLIEHPGKYIGIDGSNTARAYMYYRCLQNNFSYLEEYFKMFGVKYYVRLLRPMPDDTYDFDVDDLVATPIPFLEKPQIPPDKLYNYFIFNLKTP